MWQFLDEIQMIARNGLHYATNSYDRERYERLLELATQAYGLALDLPPAEVRQRLTAELGHITPKLGANAAIFDPAGRILLVRRSDDQAWCQPCGWVESAEAPAAAAVRETWEETGLKVKVRRLVDALITLPGADYGPHAIVAHIYLCDVIGGTLQGSHEGEEVRYWAIDEVPVWHKSHQRYSQVALAAWQADRTAPAESR